MDIGRNFFAVRTVKSQSEKIKGGLPEFSFLVFYWSCFAHKDVADHNIQ